MTTILSGPGAILSAKAGFVKYYLHVCSKYVKIHEVPATGSKIEENLGKNGKNYLTLRPRARPPGIRRRFLHE